MMKPSQEIRSDSGQAMVEFIVALVAILALFAGILEIGQLGLLHSRAMMEARRQAGGLAMQDLAAVSGPAYIRNRTPGPDQTPYSRDDSYTSAFPGDFLNHIVIYSRPGDLAHYVPNNLFHTLSQSPAPHLYFGLVNGHCTYSTNLLPVVRHLLYDSTTIDVKGDAWLTWTKGIY